MNDSAKRPTESVSAYDAVGTNASAPSNRVAHDRVYLLISVVVIGIVALAIWVRWPVYAPPVKPDVAAPLADSSATLTPVVRHAVPVKKSGRATTGTVHESSAVTPAATPSRVENAGAPVSGDAVSGTDTSKTDNETRSTGTEKTIDTGWRVAFIRGAIKWRRARGAPWRVLAVDSPVRPGEVKVSPRGEAVITDGKSRKRLSGGERIRVSNAGTSAKPVIALTPAEPVRSDAGDSDTGRLSDLLSADVPKSATQSGVVGALFIKNPDSGEDTPLRLTRCVVRTTIENGMALTELDLTFFNNTPRQTEGVFRMTVPADAAVARLAMWTTPESLMEGEIVEKRYARRVYRSIVRRMQDPALMEWREGNIFETRVFPIPANGPKRLLISYTELLPAESGRVTYRLPLAGELTKKFPIEHFALSVKVASDREILSASIPAYPNADMSRTAHALTLKLAREQFSPSRDVALSWTRSSDEEVVASCFRESPDKDGYVLLSVEPFSELSDDGRAPALDVLFVFDTSLSRNGPQYAGQMEAFKLALMELDPEDRFAVMPFDVTPCPLTQKFITPSGKHIVDAVTRVEAIMPLGGTDMDALFDGIGAFLSKNRDTTRQPVVVMFSDGVATLGVRQVEKLIAKGDAVLGKEHARFFGVTLGGLANRTLLNTLAKQHGGVAKQIGTGDDLDVEIFKLAALFKTPLLTGLTLDGGGVITDIVPNQLGAIKPGQEVFVIGKYSKDGVADANLSDDRSGRRPVAVELDGDADTNLFIPRMWARFRMEDLRVAVQTPAVRDEIISLSKTFTLISPYTSFLVLETDADYKKYGIDRNTRKKYWENPAFAVPPGGWPTPDELKAAPIRQPDGSAANPSDTTPSGETDAAGKSHENAVRKSPLPAVVLKPRAPGGAFWDDFNLRLLMPSGGSRRVLATAVRHLTLGGDPERPKPLTSMTAADSAGIVLKRSRRALLSESGELLVKSDSVVEELDSEQVVLDNDEGLTRAPIIDESSDWDQPESTTASGWGGGMASAVLIGSVVKKSSADTGKASKKEYTTAPQPLPVNAWTPLSVPTPQLSWIQTRDYLTAAQNEDGSWGTDDKTIVPVTAWVLLALQSETIKTRPKNVNEAINNGMAFLISKVDPGTGAIQTDAFNQALALLALSEKYHETIETARHVVRNAAVRGEKRTSSDDGASLIAKMADRLLAMRLVKNGKPTGWARNGSDEPDRIITAWCTMAIATVLPARNDAAAILAGIKPILASEDTFNPKSFYPRHPADAVTAASLTVMAQNIVYDSDAATIKKLLDGVLQSAPLPVSADAVDSMDPFALLVESSALIAIEKTLPDAFASMLVSTAKSSGDLIGSYPPFKTPSVFLPSPAPGSGGGDANGGQEIPAEILRAVHDTPDDAGTLRKLARSLARVTKSAQLFELMQQPDYTFETRAGQLVAVRLVLLKMAAGDTAAAARLLTDIYPAVGRPDVLMPLLVDSLVISGKTPAAIETLTADAHANRFDISRAQRMATLLFDPKSKITDPYQYLVNSIPEDVDGVLALTVMLGDLFEKAGNHLKAMAFYKRAFRESGGNVALAGKYVAACRAAGKRNTAEDFLLTLMGYGPEWFSYYLPLYIPVVSDAPDPLSRVRSAFQHNRRQYIAALAGLKDSLLTRRRYPQVADTLQVLYRVTGRVEAVGLEAVDACRLAGQNARAEALLASMFRGGLSSWAGISRYIDVLRFRGADSVDIFRAATSEVEMNALNIDARRRLAEWFKKRGNISRAVFELNQAFSIWPEDPDDGRLIAKMALESGDMDTYEAVQFTLLETTWLSEQGDVWGPAERALRQLADQYEKRGDHEKAAGLKRRIARAVIKDLVVRLKWNQPNDEDLRVIEPGGMTCSYQNKSTAHGGVLDHDDTDGYGPETYTMKRARPGDYKIEVNQFAGDMTVQATVTVITGKDGPDEKTRTFTVTTKKTGDTQVVTTITFPIEP